MCFCSVFRVFYPIIPRCLLPERRLAKKIYALLVLEEMQHVTDCPGIAVVLHFVLHGSFGIIRIGRQ